MKIPQRKELAKESIWKVKRLQENEVEIENTEQKDEEDEELKERVSRKRKPNKKYTVLEWTYLAKATEENRGQIDNETGESETDKDKGR